MIGFRVPSINNKIAARMSIKRALRNSFGLKARRDHRGFTNLGTAAYNRIYNRASRTWHK